MKTPQTEPPSGLPLASCSHSFVFCDGCGKIHEDTDEFRICGCGRVGVRMDWATPAQIAESENSELVKMQIPEIDTNVQALPSDDMAQDLAAHIGCCPASCSSSSL